MNRNGWSDAQLMASMAEAASCMGEDYDDTKSMLSSAGFSCLGSGAYGSAWTRPDMKGYCVKLSSGQGDTYPAYVYWAMANPMPCLPEFKHPVFSTDREQFMVMLPRYASCMSELQDSLDYSKASDIVYGYDRTNPIIPDSPLTYAARLMRDFFGADVGWDFHRGNLMWDSLTQNYVITDPMCSGNVDALVTKITGKGTARHAITEQIDFGFGSSCGKVWPRPEYADRVVTVEVGEGLSRHAAMERQRRLDQMAAFMPKDRQQPKPRAFANPGMQLFNWANMEEALAAGAELTFKPKQLRANAPRYAIGEAAQWVLDNGISPQVAERIGRMAQDWPDVRLRDHVKHCGNCIAFCLAPSVPAFIGANIPVPEKAVVNKYEVPASILRILRDSWRVQQNNNAFIDPRAQRKFRNEFDRR